MKLKAEDIESYLKLVKRHWQLSEEIEILEEAGYTSSFTDEISKGELASFDENSSGDLFSDCDDDDSDTVSYDATWNAFNDPKINGLRRELERNYKRLGEITKFLNDNSGVSKDYVELTAKFLQSKPSEQELSSLKIKDWATVDSSTQKDIDAVRTNVQYAIKEYIKGKNNNLYYHLGDWSDNQQFGALRVIENKLTYIANKDLQWEWK